MDLLKLSPIHVQSLNSYYYFVFNNNCRLSDLNIYSNAKVAQTLKHWLKFNINIIIIIININHDTSHCNII